MTTALATTNAPSITAEQMLLITKTVAKDATPDELKLYLYDCARQGVHPLDKLVHFTKRGGKYTPVTSIDFMRIQAAATGEYAGSDDAVFFMDPSDPSHFAATVTVWRLVQGQRCAFTATARWSEYKPDQAFMWMKMPHTMLGKCAEALALRKGFPKQLAGLYSREEMDQAGSEPSAVISAPMPVQPPPLDVDTETGEVREELAGALYIKECTPMSGGKKAGSVTFADGVIATVWASDGKLFDLAADVCQKGEAVIAHLLPGKGNYGPTLKGLKRWRDAVPEPPVQVDADSIPF